MYRLIILFLVICFSTLQAQSPKKWTSTDIHEGIKKLNVLGSVLYVAAHPDDENTRLIAYMANELKMNTAYLSLTRGDGGQNLIGPEIRELLGVIRTQELLAARRIDGGYQFFSRANDFGYSKHPDETLEIWNKDAVLSDMIWTIRNWKPDVIINRFNHVKTRSTHGHHTASAMLSYEAFDLANDKTTYPEQLKYVAPHQPQRLFFNTSWWFYGSREKFADADKSKMAMVDAGVYYPAKGKSNTEIAAESRSMHKCQGFGSTGTRGIEMEYMKLLKGDMPKDKKNIFDGINTTWTRLKGGAPIGKILATVEQNYNHNNPAASVPQLIEAYKLIKQLPDDGYWKNIKKTEIEQIILACMGFFAETIASDYSATPGDALTLSSEIINRSDIDVQLKTFSISPIKKDTLIAKTLANNEGLDWQQIINIPTDMSSSNPYWLNTEGSLGMYEVNDQLKIGLPETPRPITVTWELSVMGEPLTLQQPIVYKQTDPVKGEVYRPFEIVIPAFANIQDKVYVFANQTSKPVSVKITAGKPNVKGTLSLELPKGWKVEPSSIPFDLSLKGAEYTAQFQLFPPSTQSEGQIKAVLNINNKEYDKSLVLIDYDHIPVQTVLQPATARAVNIDLKTVGKKIAYIMGAGDDIPNSLAQIGYEVDLLTDEQISSDNLQQYDAVIMGVRAYNTNERLKFHQNTLLDYVKNGGTMIVQYNTNRRLKVDMDEIGPYPLNISRDRVSVEEAEIRILAPNHRVLNYPNKITSKDFENWVQERGLYFPDEWDKAYTPILSANDPTETPKDGGLLVAPYGKGQYVYTGYSWFRELPAGVPGAFRLFANLIAVGEE